MAKPALLCAQSVSAQYTDKTVLNNVSIQLHGGETVGLLGLNGAGKSTLLKILAGQTQPATGSVSIVGYDLALTPQDARANIGYAPETPPLYPELKVAEYLAFAARLRRLSQPAAAAAVDRVLQSCELTHAKDRLIGNLSQGYKQRVNLAQALVHEPKILLLDEPLNALDPAQICTLRDTLLGATQNQTVLYSSHQLSEVKATCHRAIVIHDGRVLLDTELSQNAGQTTLELHLTQNTPQTDIVSLPGVISANPLSPKHWLLTTQKPTILREALLARKLNGAVTPVSNHLERLFSALSRTPEALS